MASAALAVAALAALAALPFTAAMAAALNRYQYQYSHTSSDPAPRAPIRYPMPPIGVNNDPQELIKSCPSRRYRECFATDVRRRYPLTVFKKRHRPFRCYELSTDASTSECRELTPDEVPTMDTTSRHSMPLPTCDPAAPPLQATAPPPPYKQLTCGSNASLVDSHALLVLGVPSSPNAKGRSRRDAIRRAWMRDAHVSASTVIVCFLLSSETPRPALTELEAEGAEHGDLLLVDAPETPWLVQRPTAYSNFTRRGRGMPTFKQHRFFQVAASRWPNVPYVGKVDDDTAPSLRLLVPLLLRLRCARKPHLFIGAINWAGVVPRARRAGVRLGRRVPQQLYRLTLHS